jgi:outer membrane immunogenic protein
MTGLAHAAGPYYTTQEPLTVYSWAGPYLDETDGYPWVVISHRQVKPSGFAGGVEAGYNWYCGGPVFGGEPDTPQSGADDTLAAWQFSNPWFGTLRGQAAATISNAEAGFAPRWSAQAEWLYLDLSDRASSAADTSNELAADLLRMGVNYRF